MVSLSHEGTGMDLLMVVCCIKHTPAKCIKIGSGEFEPHHFTLLKTGKDDWKRLRVCEFHPWGRLIHYCVDIALRLKTLFLFLSCTFSLAHLPRFSPCSYSMLLIVIFFGLPILIILQIVLHFLPPTLVYSPLSQTPLLVLSFPRSRLLTLSALLPHSFFQIFLCLLLLLFLLIAFLLLLVPLSILLPGPIIILSLSIFLLLPTLLLAVHILLPLPILLLLPILLRFAIRLLPLPILLLPLPILLLPLAILVLPIPIFLPLP